MIYDNSENEYRIDQYNSVTQNLNSLIGELDNNAEFRLLIKYNEKSEAPFYTVSEIGNGLEKYLTYDVWREYYIKSSFKVVGIVLFLDLIVFIFIFSTIYVGRNPDKFSDRVLHMFYKRGHIRKD